MKKKLLITLGCSYTEGVGCYDESLFKSKTLDGLKTEVLHPDIAPLHRKSFHKKGWPNKLGKLMGYHKVINMGLASSSTAGQMKSFYELYYNDKFEDYETTIIWLLPDASRFAMYSSGVVRNMMPSYLSQSTTKNWLGYSLTKGYIEFINDSSVDPLLDQLFYVKTMEQYCQNNNFNLILTHVEYKADCLLKFYHKSPYYITSEPTRFLLGPDHPKKETSPICGHPNEFGYQVMAEKMYKLIEKNHSHILPKTPASEDEFEWEYGGYGLCFITPTHKTLMG